MKNLLVIPDQHAHPDFNNNRADWLGKLIIDTLNHDPDPERRAAAAFLIGHFTNPHEIVSLLSPHVSDPSSFVRNNVLRVLGATIQKAKITQINVPPLLDLLDSPFDTDRNKALWVLYTAADEPKSKPVIIQQGGKKLVSLLRLKQPNNHQLAYEVLLKVSGKNFGENDLVSWENWLRSAQRGMT